MGQQQHLLLVDDEPNILKSLTRILRKDGYKIVTASNGTEALEKLNNNKFSVILTDERMPHMRGAEFLQRAKEIQPDSVRMILSGYTDFDSIINSINNGSIYKFLNKPWNDNEIRDAIKAAFEIYEKQSKSNEVEELTGLLKRSIFINKLTELIQKEAYLLINVNLDRFININSAYGYQIGDQLLKLIGERLQAWIILNSGLICRMSGDEYGVAVPLTNKPVNEIAQSLKDEFNKPFIFEKKHF